MIRGIASLGEGRTATRTKGGVSVAHTLGGAVGGAGMAAGIWLVGTPLRTFIPTDVLMVGFFTVALLASLIDLGVVHRPLVGRQVPATWVRRHGWSRSYAMYGIILGSGLLAHIPYALTLTVFAAVGLLLPPGPAITVGLVFGLTRTVLVGPAALHAEISSRLLYESSWSQRLVPKLSILTCVIFAASVFAFVS